MRLTQAITDRPVHGYHYAMIPTARKTTMLGRLTTIATVTALLLLGLLAGAAGAQGVSPDRLTDAGWDCFLIPELGIHCTEDASSLEPGPDFGTDDAVPVLVFDVADEEFLGTELLLHDRVFDGQPCPQDGGSYAAVAGGTYWACHHYDTHSH